MYALLKDIQFALRGLPNFDDVAAATQDLFVDTSGNVPVGLSPWCC